MDFDASGALAGRYKAGGIRVLVFVARPMFTYRAVVYYHQANGVIRMVYNGLAIGAVNPKAAARMGIRNAARAGRIKNVPTDIHERIRLEEW